MAKSLEERIKEAIRLQFEDAGPPPTPRRITITVPQDVYDDVHELAKGIGESWSFTASLLLREAADYGLRAFGELGYRITRQEGIHPNKAKEMLLNPEMADQDPEQYRMARNLQAMGLLLPEVPPEDPGQVYRARMMAMGSFRELPSDRQEELIGRLERGELSWSQAVDDLLGPVR